MGGKIKLLKFVSSILTRLKMWIKLFWSLTPERIQNKKLSPKDHPYMEMGNLIGILITSHKHIMKMNFNNWLRKKLNVTVITLVKKWKSFLMIWVQKQMVNRNNLWLNKIMQHKNSLILLLKKLSMTWKILLVLMLEEKSCQIIFKYQVKEIIFDLFLTFISN